MDRVPNNTRDAAVWYAKRGWGVVPISMHTKKPIIEYWSKRPFTDPDATADFFGRQQCNIGILAGFSGLVCVDCDGEEGLAAFFGLIDQNGGEIGEPWVASTPGGGKHFVYNHPDDGVKIKSRSKRHDVPIDVKADGGQFLVEPSAAKSGKQYKWEQAIDGSPGDMPGWLLAWVVADDTAEEKSRKAARAAKKAPRVNGTVYTDLPLTAGEKLTTFLAKLENCRQSGENHWMACCPAHESKGRNSLSVMAGNVQPVVVHCFAGCEAELVFKAVGMSIFDACQDLEIEHLPDIEAVAAAVLNGQASEEEEAEAIPLDPGPFPQELLSPPGLLGAVIEHNLTTAMYPQPALALAGALTLMATITGRRVRDERDTRTNIYVVGIAPTSAGKDHARKRTKKILHEAGGEKMLGSERIGSHAGIINAVHANPAILFQIDEISHLLATMRNSRNSPWLYNIASVLLQLYGSSDGLWVADALADVDRVKRIDQPHCVVYGSSTPEKFWANVSTDNITEGLLGRCLVFEAPYVPWQQPKPAPVPEAIIKSVRGWLAFSPGAALGNLGSTEHPTPTTVLYTHDANERLLGHLKAISEKRMSEEPIVAALWSRSGEKAAKLALLFACSRTEVWDGEFIVEIDDIDRAIKLANWLTRWLICQCRGRVGENMVELAKLRILQIIGKDELTSSILTRKTQFLNARERRELVDDLLSAGRIIRKTVVTDGRTKTVFYRSLVH